MSVFAKRDINAGAEEFLKREGAVLIDVREPSEYKKGHIKGAVNLPLSAIGTAKSVLPDKSAPLYVYCLSGGRSRKAVSVLKSAGYREVHDIGGIAGYTGSTEK